MVDNLEEGHRQAVDPRADFHQVDIGSAEDLAGVLRDFRPDAVMHLAASTLVSESMSDPGKCFRNNVEGARRSNPCRAQLDRW